MNNYYLEQQAKLKAEQESKEQQTGSKVKLKLPAISEAGLQALELLSEDLISLTELPNYLSKDPLIASTIIKYANSPVYRRPTEVKSIRTAVGLLGLKRCKMAVGVTILRAMNSPSTVIGDKIWAHCTNNALVARILAEKIYPDIMDDIENTALMHDIGMMILNTSNPEQYANILSASTAKDEKIEQAERAIFGTNHSEVVLQIAQKLYIPQVTIDCIKQFHDEEPLTRINTEVDKHLIICHFAHLIVDNYNESIASQEQITDSIAHDFENISLLLDLSEDAIRDLVEDCEMMLNVF